MYFEVIQDDFVVKKLENRFLASFSVESAWKIKKKKSNWCIYKTLLLTEAFQKQKSDLNQNFL